MAERPVIVIVDDEPDALALLLEALQRRFGADYRIAPYLTARAALDDPGGSRRAERRSPSSSPTSGCRR